LNDGDECSGGVESVSKEKEGNEVKEGLGKMTDFADCEEDLLPADG
jgi:hypothetical protein